MIIRKVTVLLVFTALGAGAGAPTYNGIVLPDEWPPRMEKIPNEPGLPPYLKTPPEVIPIDLGRQLFVDDFLIEDTNMTRECHLPKYHPANPVLKADQPWEETGHGDHQGAMAMPFSGGIWFDPADNLFKMWYFADYRDRHLCYATSKDGIAWEKPLLDIIPGTNVVFPNAAGASVVWLDLEEKNPERRFKFVLSRAAPGILEPGTPWSGSLCTMHTYSSPDGIHWGSEMARTGPCGDRNSAFWNPFRQRWVFSIRHHFESVEGVPHRVRCRKYWESPDLVANTLWKSLEPPLWIAADSLDTSIPPGSITPELYDFDAVAYESLMVGFFAIQRATANDKEFRPKLNEICVGFSRDGFHWSRPDHRSFMGVSEDRKAWNWGNMQPVGGGCLVVGDELRFYASGRKGDPGQFCDAGGSTGLATLRRDGFVSMNAGDETATLTTRPLRFSGAHLFVNLAAKEGELSAEILDAAGNAIAPFGAGDCVAINGDSTKCALKWKGAADLSSLAGKPVRIRFHLRRGALYSFWVSSDASGESLGYVAAGGPGFAGARDMK